MLGRTKTPLGNLHRHGLLSLCSCQGSHPASTGSCQGKHAAEHCPMQHARSHATDVALGVCAQLPEGSSEQRAEEKEKMVCIPGARAHYSPSMGLFVPGPVASQPPARTRRAQNRPHCHSNLQADWANCSLWSPLPKCTVGLWLV